ncbi:MAG: hypothetical protein WC721_03415 [Victivallaceae bacterium]|jgi:hypothetical protein
MRVKQNNVVLSGTPRSRNVDGEKSGDRRQNSEWEPVNQQAKTKCIVLNDTPISRNAEARECGSVPRLRVPRMRE